MNNNSKKNLMTGSKIILESLIREGVDTIFGYPGGAVLNIYDELFNYKDKIKHILSIHVENGFIGTCNLGADCRRKSVTHRTESA